LQLLLDGLELLQGLLGLGMFGSSEHLHILLDLILNNKEKVIKFASSMNDLRIISGTLNSKSTMTVI